MILSDGEIQEEIRRKRIIIDPPVSEEQYTTSALDLLLGDELLELRTREELAKEEPPGVERPVIVDLAQVDVRNLLQKYAKPLPKQTDGSFILDPNKFVLGITREYINLPRRSKIAARVEGRSTLARLGLVIHLTAPTIDEGEHSSLPVLRLPRLKADPFSIKVNVGFLSGQGLGLDAPARDVGNLHEPLQVLSLPVVEPRLTLPVCDHALKDWSAVPRRGGCSDPR